MPETHEQHLQRLGRGIWSMGSLRPLTRGLLGVYAPEDITVWGKPVERKLGTFVKEVFPSITDQVWRRAAHSPSLHLPDLAMQDMICEVADPAVTEACTELGFMGRRPETIDTAIRLAKAINTGGRPWDLLVSTMGLVCLNAIQGRQRPTINL